MSKTWLGKRIQYELVRPVLTKVFRNTLGELSITDKQIDTDKFEIIDEFENIDYMESTCYSLSLFPPFL